MSSKCAGPFLKISFFFRCFSHIFAIPKQLPGFFISRLPNVEEFCNIDIFFKCKYKCEYKTIIHLNYLCSISFQVVSDGFRWFQVAPCFTKYEWYHTLGRITAGKRSEQRAFALDTKISYYAVQTITPTATDPYCSAKYYGGKVSKDLCARSVINK